MHPRPMGQLYKKLVKKSKPTNRAASIHTQAIQQSKRPPQL